MLTLILAGGHQTRFQLTEPGQKGIPKALVEVDGKPLLAHTLEKLRSSSNKGSRRVTDVLICNNYADDFESVLGSDWGRLNVDYTDERDRTGPVGALKFALPLIPRATQLVLVLNGDTISDVNFDEMISKAHSDSFKNHELTSVISTQRVNSAFSKDFPFLLKVDNSTDAGDYIFETSKGSRVGENLNLWEHELSGLLAFTTVEICTGAYIIPRSAIANATADIETMDDLVSTLRYPSVYRTKWFLDVGTPEGLAEAQRIKL